MLVETHQDPNQGLETNLKILILQHPQEPDVELGSARLVISSLKNSKLRIGLSWPNLARALLNDSQTFSKNWLVLYLGAGIKTDLSTKSEFGDPVNISSKLIEVNKKGHPVKSLNSTARAGIEGIVLLDGTWSQAKALWWRNPWLLKLRRAILIPSRKSIYKSLRKEPRLECLSTLESIAETLLLLGEDQAISRVLLDRFQHFLNEKKPTSSRGLAWSHQS